MFQHVQLISGKYSFSIALENTRKHLAFCCFQEGEGRWGDLRGGV